MRAAQGDLAVVGLLFEPGEPSPLVQTILDAAPPSGESASEGIALNARRPASRVRTRLTTRYDGSKTTPPCDEGVSWFVMREPRTISQEQVAALQALSGGPSNRPVQPIGSRAILLGGALLARPVSQDYRGNTGRPSLAKPVSNVKTGALIARDATAVAQSTKLNPRPRSAMNRSHASTCIRLSIQSTWTSERWRQSENSETTSKPSRRCSRATVSTSVYDVVHNSCSLSTNRS